MTSTDQTAQTEELSKSAKSEASRTGERRMNLYTVTLTAIGEERKDFIVESEDNIEVTKREIRDKAQEIRQRDDIADLYFHDVAELLEDKTGYSFKATPKFEVKVE